MALLQIKGGLIYIRLQVPSRHPIFIFMNEEELARQSPWLACNHGLFMRRRTLHGCARFGILREAPLGQGTRESERECVVILNMK